MKFGKPDSIFQLAKTSFNAPSLVIQLFHYADRELISWQVGNQAFISIVGDFESYCPKIQLIRFFFDGKKSEDLIIHDTDIFFRMPLYFIGLQSGNFFSQIKVELLILQIHGAENPIA